MKGSLPCLKLTLRRASSVPIVQRTDLTPHVPAAASLRPVLAGEAAGEVSLEHGVQLQPRGRGPVLATVAALRPRQWIKNGLVVAAAGAAGTLGRDDVPQRVLLACAAFCLLASGIYAINDVCDAAEDRMHPRKCRRPVAAGELSAHAATGLGVGLMLLGMIICAVLSPLLALVGAGYLALTLSYTLVWRHVLVLDILAVAGGFVLRALAGGIAAGVGLSRWFVLVVTAAAVFIAAAKRLAELRRAGEGGMRRRRVLDRYTPEALLLTLGASAGIALTAYCVWALRLPSGHGSVWRPLTIAPFAACLLRYLSRAMVGDGEAPEELVVSDPPLLLAALAWLVLFGLAVHAGA